MTMSTNHPRASLARPRKSLQTARNAPPPLPDAARRPRRDAVPPPAMMAPPPPVMMARPMPPPVMMARPMPPPAYRDDLDNTVVKAIAMPPATSAAPPPQAPLEDPLSPATEARAAITARARRHAGPFAFSRAAVERAMKRLASDYRELSNVKRLLIPIAIILLFAAAPSSSRAGETTKRPVAAVTATPATLAAPTATPATPKPALLPAVAAATPPAALPLGGVLPSARALAPSSQTALSPEERRQYDRAITATLAGDFDAAEVIYVKLSAAHPDSAELSAAARVLEAKKKRKAGR